VEPVSISSNKHRVVKNPQIDQNKVNYTTALKSLAETLFCNLKSFEKMQQTVALVSKFEHS